MEKPSAAAWNVPIEGMDCADCAKTIERSLGDLPGVQSARVQFAAGKAEVSYDSRQIGPVELGKRVRELGYSVREETAEMWIFDVGGMDCADCARTVESGVNRLPGVVNAQVNFAAATLSVLPAAANLSKQQVIPAVEQAGYEAHIRGSEQPSIAAAPWWRRRRIGEIALSAVLWLLGFGLERNGLSTAVTAVPFLAAMGLAGYPVARAAWFSIKARRADMNLLMTVAAVGAIAFGEWDEGSSVLILFAIGITLQNLTLDRTRRAIQALLKLAPAEATVRRDGIEQRVLVSSITVGETLIVRAGDRLPLDGVVISGYSAVDQAPITGESVPVDIAPGASVFAGSINGDGVLELQTTKLASDTMLSRI
jgi:Cd2+/Zn2+-exporting ATPase